MQKSALARGNSWLALSALLLLAGAKAIAQQATQISYEGTLGQTRIGLTLLVKNSAITGGHYFYAKYLTDIPLTGTTQSRGLTLQGEDGGTFTLKFTGNGSEAGKALDFNTSVGLQGTWSKGAADLPVKLAMQGESTLLPSGRWYEMVTEQSDAAFEAKVQGFLKAALTGDRAAAAKYIAFPLRVNRKGKSRFIRSAAELTAQWETIFTPDYLAALQRDLPHDLGIAKGQAMLGAGDVWFSDQGATALNLP